MKKLLLAVLGTIVVLTAPEIHYRVALNAARNSELTDIAIEEAMYHYNFDVDALDPEAPSYTEKINAIILYF